MTSTPGLYRAELGDGTVIVVVAHTLGDAYDLLSVTVREVKVISIVLTAERVLITRSALALFRQH